MQTTAPSLVRDATKAVKSAWVPNPQTVCRVTNISSCYTPTMNVTAPALKIILRTMKNTPVKGVIQHARLVMGRERSVVHPVCGVIVLVLESAILNVF